MVLKLNCTWIVTPYISLVRTRHLSLVRNNPVWNAWRINWQRTCRRPRGTMRLVRFWHIRLSPVWFCNKDSVGIWPDNSTNNEKLVSVNLSGCLRNDRGFAFSGGLFMRPDGWALQTAGQATLADLVHVYMVGSNADEVVILPADFISNVRAMLSTTVLTRVLRNRHLRTICFKTNQNTIFCLNNSQFGTFPTELPRVSQHNNTRFRSYDKGHTHKNTSEH